MSPLWLLAILIWISPAILLVAIVAIGDWSHRRRVRQTRERFIADCERLYDWEQSPAEVIHATFTRDEHGQRHRRATGRG